MTLCGFDLTHRRGQVSAAEPAPEWAQATDRLAGQHICGGCLQSLATDRIKSDLGATELGGTIVMIDGNRDAEPYVALAMLGAAMVAGFTPRNAWLSLSGDGRRAAWSAVWGDSSAPLDDRLPTEIVLGELTGPRTVTVAGTPATDQTAGQSIEGAHSVSTDDESTRGVDGSASAESDDRLDSSGATEHVGTDRASLEDHA